jgi:hypothetical protein
MRRGSLVGVLTRLDDLGFEFQLRGPLRLLFMVIGVIPAGKVAGS